VKLHKNYGESQILNLDRLYFKPQIFARLTGINIAVFRRIVEKVRPEWDKLCRKKKCHGRNSHLKSLEYEILLVLFYYRSYTSFLFLGMIFNLDASNVCRHIKRLEPILAKVIKINKNRRLSQSEFETLIVDATEIQIQRPCKGQRKFYSGKKKKHTMKFEILVNSKGKIIDISKCYPGRTHDFKIKKLERNLPLNSQVLADSGYQGLQKIHKNTILPHKRRRKIPLIYEQKIHNRELSSKRGRVEHVIGKMKKFKILSSVYRNFRRKLNLRANIIAGIYNLSVS